MEESDFDSMDLDHLNRIFDKDLKKSTGKLYTEEEVKRLCKLAMSEGMSFNISALDRFERWFELNKKK
jgi:hypothetical protein